MVGNIEYSLWAITLCFIALCFIALCVINCA